MSFPIMLRQVFWGPDLVITVAPALVCAPTALLTARLSGAQACYTFRISRLMSRFIGPAEGQSVCNGLILQMERSLLHRFDSVSSISGRMVSAS